MPAFDDLPVASDPDPIDSDDEIELRAEILRLREGILGANGRHEVLLDRIAELEARETDLAAANAALHDELARTPLRRAVHAVRRALRGVA